MRVLIDGMDLTGKTTLAWRLVEALRAAGIPAERRAGPLVPGRVSAWTRAAYRRSAPGAASVSWGYAASAAVDALLAHDPADKVVVQEVGPEHAAAFAASFGHAGPEGLIDALRPWWPRFDLSVCLRASLPTLQARYRLRDRNDAVDTMLFTAPDRFMEIEQRLADRMRGSGAMLLRTDDLTPSELVDAVRPWAEDLWWARRAAQLREQRRAPLLSMAL